ncbi:hypothetical protein [Sulfurisphaera tokodaii]|uniref:Sulfocyanin n=1 Tax=Sulfurisphaera tokodaii TaxID=111955 RepID=A0A832TGC4_9CREN|nr:hypothetical protein [Sulfurisphaera tokodaii]HII73976.1 sulfocyanin [Sulfurisphaera tokodaii]
MKLDKIGLVLIALSAIILIIGGVFFALAAMPHTAVSTTSTSTTSTTTTSSTSSTSTTSTSTSTSSSPVWA